MNILRIIYDWPDKNTYTDGLAPAPYELSLAQSDLGNRIYVLCGNLNGKNLKQLKFSYSLEGHKNIIVYNLPRGLSKFGPFLTTSFFVLPYYFYLKFTKKIDLVHNHGQLGIWFLLYKYLFGLIDNTPIVGHYHIVAKSREVALKKQSAKVSFLTRAFEYPLHKFSDFLMSRVSNQMVTVSLDLKKDLIDIYRVPENKITLLESSVDANRFNKSGPTIDFGFSSGSVIIANGGRLSKRKNIDVLVSSLKHLDERFKLVLWGQWDQSFKKEVDQIIADNNLSSRIKDIGLISYFEADKYYRSSDIFVLPSSYEGLPKVVMEALSSGCKVLASGFSVDKEIPDLHFIADINPNSLAILIESLAVGVSNYEDTRSIIESAYSWRSKALILEKIYKSVILNKG